MPENRNEIWYQINRRHSVSDCGTKQPPRRPRTTRVSHHSAVHRDLQHAPPRKLFHAFEHTKSLYEVRAMFPNPRHDLKTIPPHHDAFTPKI